MSEHPKITAAHLRRGALVYVRQSTAGQVERNSESTARQYDLVDRAVSLGWARDSVRIVDDDLGVSGASTAGRTGFAELAAQVGLGEVAIVLALESSRLARSNADWYRLLDLAGACDTLIGDPDGVYHPALFNDRLLLDMKGTMSEAELHILRARLDGGARNKAARGELRRALPVGLVWGEADGEIRLHSDEAVVAVISAIFERFAVCGSARGVWMWLRQQGLKFPLQPSGYLTTSELTWVEPTYHAVHTVLTHPAYAGAYTFGRTRTERYVDDDGALRTRRRKLPQHQCEVLLTDHHPGFIDWDTYQANQARLAANTRPAAHEPGTGAVREGCALLQGLATCGVCARKLAVLYTGPHKATPGYYCTGTGHVMADRATRHLRVGGAAIDAAVAETFLAALAPGRIRQQHVCPTRLEKGLRMRVRQAIGVALTIPALLLAAPTHASADTEDTINRQESISEEESGEASFTDSSTRDGIVPDSPGPDTSAVCTVFFNATAAYNKEAGEVDIEERGVGRMESDCTMQSMTVDVTVMHRCFDAVFSDSDSNSGTDTDGPLKTVAYQEVPIFGALIVPYCSYGTEIDWNFEFRYTWPDGEHGCQRMRAATLYGGDVVFVGDSRQCNLGI
jgi:DNA invertase Pin-like site-specific DNA recombinase